MTLKEQLMQDLKTAMKEKDTIKKNVVTLVRAAILQYEKDNKAELDDEGVAEIISKQLKQRKDALSDFVKAGREDLIETTNKEIALLTAYLPEQLSKEELQAIVKEAVEKLQVTEIKQMGKVMAEVMPKVKGRADGKAISDVVKALLSEQKA
jgi:uncharacterized protein YqeY